MRVFRIFIAVTAIILLLAGLAATILPFLRGAKLLSVQTESMEPVFSPGDAVWVEKLALQHLSPGDIISYRSPQDDRIIVSHRLAMVDYEKGKFITKGDNAALNDLPLDPGLVIGRVKHVIPGAGSLLDWLRSPEGIFLAVYTPALLIILGEFKRLAARLRHTNYHLHGYNRDNSIDKLSAQYHTKIIN